MIDSLYSEEATVSLLWKEQGLLDKSNSYRDFNWFKELNDCKLLLNNKRTSKWVNWANEVIDCI